MIIQSEFKPAWWLTNPHGQTIYASIIRRYDIAPIDRTERIELPDGDFIDIAWAINGLPPEAPLVVLLHGLGGNVRSSYVGGLLRAFNRYGWRAVLMHFRGASDEPNRLLRAYHSGDTNDLNFLLHRLAEREPFTKKAVVGVSLGGNVILKWLGEQKKQCLISAAVAISVPFKMRLVADKVNQGFSRIYQQYMLNRLKLLFKKKIETYPGDIPSGLQEIDRWQCFWTFDEYVTAPLYGFPNVHAYYRDMSSLSYLKEIKTKTLIIHAIDDPFMTPDVLPHKKDLSTAVTLEISSKGGHVGFIAGSVPGVPIYWLEQRVPEYLKQYFS